MHSCCTICLSVISLSNSQKLCIRPLVGLNKHDYLRTVSYKNLESIAQDCNDHLRTVSCKNLESIAQDCNDYLRTVLYKNLLHNLDL